MDSTVFEYNNGHFGAKLRASNANGDYINRDVMLKVVELQTRVLHLIDLFVLSYPDTLRNTDQKWSFRLK